MNQRPKTRQQKLVEAIYPFFGDLAREADEDEYAWRVCRHLLALKSDAIDDINIAPFIQLWDMEHPEENSLTNSELIWALLSLDEHIASQMKKLELEMIKASSTRAKLRVINGGLSDNPDRPYDPTAKHLVTF